MISFPCLGPTPGAGGTDRSVFQEGLSTPKSVAWTHRRRKVFCGACGARRASCEIVRPLYWRGRGDFSGVRPARVCCGSTVAAPQLARYRYLSGLLASEGQTDQTPDLRLGARVAPNAQLSDEALEMVLRSAAHGAEDEPHFRGVVVDASRHRIRRHELAIHMDSLHSGLLVVDTRPEVKGIVHRVLGRCRFYG